METRTLNSRLARIEWRNLLDDAWRGRRTIITRDEKPIAAVVSVEDLRQLEGKMSEDRPPYAAGDDTPQTSDEIIAFALQKCGGDARCAEAELAEALAKLLRERR